jgi:hypothetical protein
MRGKHVAEDELRGGDGGLDRVAKCWRRPSGLAEPRSSPAGRSPPAAAAGRRLAARLDRPS